MKKLGIILIVFSLFCLISCSKNNNNDNDIVENKLNISMTIPSGFSEKHNDYKYGELNRYEYYSNITKSNKHYSIITPRNYDSSKSYPLLIVFPTLSSPDDMVIEELNMDIIVGNLIYEHKIRDVIILVVNHLMNEAENFTVGDMYKSDLSPKDTYENVLPVVKNNYKIIEDEIYIYGFSMGGRQAINYILQYGGVKEAILVEPYYYDDSIDIKYTSCEHLYLIQGIQDGVVFELPKKLHKVFNKAGIKHEYYEINYNHNYDTGKDLLYMFLITSFGGE